MIAPKTCEQSTGGGRCGAPAEYRVTWRVQAKGATEDLCGEHARAVDDLGAIVRAVRL